MHVRWPLNRHACVAGAADSSPSELADVWRGLVVRVLSARCYDYAGGDAFYDDDMKQWAAMEHSMLALLARDGRRYVFPRVGHDKLFLEVPAIVACAREVDAALQDVPAAAPVKIV
jgi:hypothetical protein